MISRISTIFTVATLGLCLTASVSLAGAIDDIIVKRQACMKANGASMGVFVPMMQGAKPFDAAAVATSVASVEAACADWAKWWAPDTMKGEMAKTKAKPEIWSDAAGFEKAGAAYYTALGEVKAAKDDAAFKAAFGHFGGSCKGCHTVYRAADE